MTPATTETLTLGESKPIDVLLKACPNPRMILDIGAGSGFFCQIFRAHYPHAEIWAYEPLRSFSERLRVRTDPRRDVFNLACGDRSGYTTLNVTASPESSSILMPIARDGALGRAHLRKSTRRVMCVRLDEQIERDKWAQIDLIKIDVQGSELAVLRGLGDIIMQPCHILIEVMYESLYERQGTPQEIDEYLTTRGYKLLDEFPGEMPQIWADRLYGKTTEI